MRSCELEVRWRKSLYRPVNCSDVRGWSRKFRFEMNGNFVRERKDRNSYTCQNPRHRHRGWFIPEGLTSDCFILKIIPIKAITTREEALLKTTLKIIIEKAGIGARTQSGFGIIDYYEPGRTGKIRGLSLADF